MTNDTPQPAFEPQPETPPVYPGVIPPPPAEPKKSRKVLWIILGVALGLFACCCIAGVVGVVYAGINIAKEKAPAEAVLDKYMKAMVARDAERAYALFSPRARRQIPLSDIEEMLEGNNYVLVERFQSLSIVNLNVNAMVNSDPDKPQGTVAKVLGTISYKGGIQGSFNGILEKVNGEWQIDGFHITVPPKKFK